jgi:hypothetical protein
MARCSTTSSSVTAAWCCGVEVMPMNGSGRNDVCRYGSGKKAKRCCGTRRGPSPAELARAFLADERRKAARVLLDADLNEFDELFDEIIDLPTLDVSLQTNPPRLLTPELERLRVALDEDDEDAFDDAVDAVVDQLDTPEVRATLARAVLKLRDLGRIDRRLAATAIIDLWTPHSGLFQASVVQSIAVSVGAAKTPSGLLVVSR